MKKQLISLFLIFVLLLSFCTVSYAVKPATLSLKSTGDNVKSLQKSLISLGYLKGKADGVFGSKTEEAVKKFQKANDLTVDGLAGADTQGAINAVLKKKNSGPSYKAAVIAGCSKLLRLIHVMLRNGVCYCDK